jgi:hypothetical protein
MGEFMNLLVMRTRDAMLSIQAEMKLPLMDITFRLTSWEDAWGEEVAFNVRGSKAIHLQDGQACDVGFTISRRAIFDFGIPDRELDRIDMTRILLDARARIRERNGFERLAILPGRMEWVMEAPKPPVVVRCIRFRKKGGK